MGIGIRSSRIVYEGTQMGLLITNNDNMLMRYSGRKKQHLQVQ